MSNVTRLHHALPLPADVIAATRALDAALAKAIVEAKVAGLPKA